MVDPLSYFRSIQSSMTGITKAVVYDVGVGWCI